MAYITIGSLLRVMIRWRGCLVFFSYLTSREKLWLQVSPSVVTKTASRPSTVSLREAIAICMELSRITFAILLSD